MIRSVKICMVCCLTKPVKYESDYKKKDNGMNGEGRSTLIHEYNYSCYECLDNMQKQREKELRDIYDKMMKVGLI